MKGRELIQWTETKSEKANLMQDNTKRETQNRKSDMQREDR